MKFLLLSILATQLVACGNPVLQTDNNETAPTGKACDEGPVTQTDIDELRSKITDNSGLDVNVVREPCAHDDISCQVPSESHGILIKSMLETMHQEFARYPKTFLQTYGPVRIWLTSALKSKNLFTGYAGGIALYTRRVIYLNVDSSCDETWRKMLVQHEFFHILDKQLFVGRNWEKAWSELNPPGFKYLDDYKKEPQKTGWHPADGFVSGYAQTNANEDRADTFAFRVVGELTTKLNAWMSTDSYLKRKVSGLEYWVKNKWPQAREVFNNSESAGRILEDERVRAFDESSFIKVDLQSR